MTFPNGEKVKHTACALRVVCSRRLTIVSVGVQYVGQYLKSNPDGEVRKSIACRRDSRLLTLGALAGNVHLRERRKGKLPSSELRGDYETM